MEKLDIGEVIGFLKTVPLLSSLTASELAGLAEGSKTLTYEKDSYIFKKYAFPNNLFIIKSGTIEEIVTDSNDFTTIVKTRQKTDYLGELGVILNEPYISTARTLSDVELIGIPREAFCLLVFSHEKVMKFILKTLSQRLQNSAETAISFLMFNSEGRVAYRMLMMLRELDEASTNIQTTQEHLSQLCGVARQTVSNILSGWKRDGIIETHRGFIEILNREELIEIFLENTVCR